jgi:hypothetical protein
MVLSSAQAVRSRVQDVVRLEEKVVLGNGTGSMFWLERENVLSGTAYVVTSQGWSATGSTFNSSGYVSLSAPISAASAVRLVYTYSIFSDDEIDHWLTVGGSVPGAAREAARTLMFDSMKRARWVASDGSEYDDSKGMALIRELLDKLDEEIASSSIVDGGIIEWAMTQEE